MNVRNCSNYDSKSRKWKAIGWSSKEENLRTLTMTWNEGANNCWSGKENKRFLIWERSASRQSVKFKHDDKRAVRKIKWKQRDYGVGG